MIVQPDQIVLLGQAITPIAAVNALDSDERHPWLPEGAPPEEPHSRGRLADLPGDAKLLVAQVGNTTSESCSISARLLMFFRLYFNAAGASLSIAHLDASSPLKLWPHQHARC